MVRVFDGSRASVRYLLDLSLLNGNAGNGVKKWERNPISQDNVLDQMKSRNNFKCRKHRHLRLCRQRPLKQPKNNLKKSEFFFVFGLTIALPITILTIAPNKKEFGA